MGWLNRLAASLGAGVLGRRWALHSSRELIVELQRTPQVCFDVFAVKYA